MPRRFAGDRCGGILWVESQRQGGMRIMAEQKIGVITHYFGKIGVAAVMITDGELKVGDTIRVKGHTSDFTQTVDSMQVEHASVEVARKGDEIGLKAAEYAREHDAVYKVMPD
jgi:putative protease